MRAIPSGFIARIVSRLGLVLLAIWLIALVLLGAFAIETIIAEWRRDRE